MSQTWVPTWDGWAEFVERRDAENVDLSEDVWAADLVQRFVALSIDVFVINLLVMKIVDKISLRIRIWKFEEEILLV